MPRKRVASFLPHRGGESERDCFDDKAPERAPVGTWRRRLDSLGYSQDHDSFEPGFTYREALGILAAKVSGSANVTGGLGSRLLWFVCPAPIFSCGPSKVGGRGHIEVERFPVSFSFHFV